MKKSTFDISSVDPLNPVQAFAYQHLLLGEMYNLTPSSDLKREIVRDIMYFVRDNLSTARSAFEFIRSLSDSDKSEFMDKFAELLAISYSEKEVY